ncbi:Fe(3+) ABC transporter substrate-binding protein [Maritimibacter sp. UBA3975]|uniref:Fe(3+) ABC transporter substrate-binding protein n=1 Tax=Maritimibacter sp. UBA3975 TaxID=1946833 RepID=UPI000C0A661A|nr:Fe(3+) ABC transporter substrate-binding protein [Maritimibacter sp. UBA3975]MAM60610.1 iron ABC transporter substrate-binding protein [Maritimibacter sp.]|tara:strand:- start:18398 stop:19399 length:1002 start_codon:yes stop_codon:yes gene_type:complete
MLRTTITTACLAATALPAMAEVNVYSYRQPELIQPLVDAFTEETGIEVNVAFLNTGMVERLQAEGQRSPADVVLTTDISRLSELVEADVTQPVESDVLADQIPAEYRDPGNEWFGLTRRARVVYASQERVDEGEVTTYEDLADPKWEGRICTRSGTHAYMVALTSAAIHHLGEDGAKEWLEGLKANLAQKPQGNDRAQVKSIWAGECDISIGNTYYMGAMLEDEEQTEWANSVRIEFPEFEGAGTHVNVSGMALTKAAPHREDAVAFMEFLASDEAQAIYAEAVYEYPVAEGVPNSDLVDSWGEFTADDVNLMDLAKLRPDALRITQEVDYDG